LSDALGSVDQAFQGSTELGGQKGAKDEGDGQGHRAAGQGCPPHRGKKILFKRGEDSGIDGNKGSHLPSGDNHGNSVLLHSFL
jgi:hypothetical protein